MIGSGCALFVMHSGWLPARTLRRFEDLPQVVRASFQALEEVRIRDLRYFPRLAALIDLDLKLSDLQLQALLPRLHFFRHRSEYTCKLRSEARRVGREWCARR